jgi:outer membrane protein TolC
VGHERKARTIRESGVNPRRSVLIFPILAGVLFAQGTPLTLSRAIESALARSPAILSARTGIQAAAARRLQSEARPDPAVSLATESIPWTLKAREGRETEFSFGLEQTFEFPGRRSLRVEIGKLGEDAAALELERVRLLVSADVKRAYFRTVLAAETLSALEPASETLDRLIKYIQVRIQAGGASYGDVVRARIEKARLQNRIIEARSERDAAMDELLVLMGRPPGEAPHLATGLACPPLERTAADVLAAARADRPSLKIARLEEERAAATVRLAGLNRKPDLAAGLFVPSKNFGSWGFALGFSLPLSDKRWAGARAEADSAREAAAIAVESREKRIALLVGRAYARARAAAEQIRVFERNLLVEIEEELKLAVEYYRSGKIEAYALIDMERSATEARLEYLRALHSYAVALADVEAAGEEE